jgi:hypothetical protein
MVMKRASGGDSPSSRVLGRASGPSQSHIDDGGGLHYVSWKIERALGFSHRGEYRGGRAASGGGPGGLTTWWRGPGLGCATLWCGRPLAPLCLIFGLWLMSGKIGGLAFVSSNSKNISCVAFLKHKNCKNRELALWHLVCRLVLENA